MAKSTKTTKGGKGRPKLKAILADPYKTTCPVLVEKEFVQLRICLEASIKNGGGSPRAFASAKHIHLGLQSSLRAINNRQSSCVFLSLSLKPKFVIALIGRTMAIVDATVPVFVQPKLEELTKKLFGIEAHAMVLPLQLKEISSALEKWVQLRREEKACHVQIPVVVAKAKKINKIKVRKPLEKQKEEVSTKKAHQGAPAAPWSGDFISLTNTDCNMKMDEHKLDEDKRALSDVLNKIAKDAQKLPRMDEPTSAMELVAEAVSAAEEDPNLDDFLAEYQPLTIRKIQPNPERKPKKKRKKNKP